MVSAKSKISDCNPHTVCKCVGEWTKLDIMRYFKLILQRKVQNTVMWWG